MYSNQPIDKILYFASTHWDREWYLPFQSFRQRLVVTFQEILSTLEADPAFTSFICDGQTVLIEDYLEIMPQDQNRILALIKSGRLIIGPWYTMPDENLVSGESLIANLQMGHALTNKLSPGTPVLPLGYLCDIFGHISQMPQILNGFHISNAILGRGTNECDLPAYFVWQSPNGSFCVTYKVPESCGYGSFWNEVYSDNRAIQNETEASVAYAAAERLRSPLPFVILMDGMDHTPIHPQAVRLSKALEKTYSSKVYIGGVSEFFACLHQLLNDMPSRTGELQAPAHAMEEHNKLISGTLSSRYDLKKANDDTQTLLEKKALPLSALASMYGKALPYGFEKLAYQYLLKNHAHDSICGCSTDEVHQDMLYRYRQSGQIGQEIYENALHVFLPSENILSESDNKFDLQLTLFNPLPFELNKVITADIAFPTDYPKPSFEQIPSEIVNRFLLFNADSKEIPYQIESIVNNTNVRKPTEFYGTARDIYTISFSAVIPAMGQTSCSIVPVTSPVRYYDSLTSHNLTAENEFLQLEVSPAGNVTLTDLTCNQTYPNLITYKDCGETGDGWSSRPPVPDLVTYCGTASSVAIVSDGPSRSTFCITNHLNLPTRMDYHRQFTRRSAFTNILEIKTYLSLEQHSKVINCRTIVKNSIKDHRFVLSLQTGIPSKCYYAEQAFTFVERPVQRDHTTQNWKEAEREEKAFGNILYRKRTDGSGFAFLSGGGLHEAAAHPGKEGRIDVTLFRSFEKTFLTNGQPDGQLEGELTFEYALMPFAEGTSNVELLNTADAMRVQPFSFTTRNSNGTTPAPQFSGFHLAENALYISMIKPAGDNRDHVLIRLSNYSNTPKTDRLICALTLHQAYVCDLLEAPQSTADFKENIITIALKPHEIKTLLLSFEPLPH